MPRCFKKANAANCSAAEPLAASRRYGIVRREKYKARPAELTTTFTTFGLSCSAGTLMRVAAVDISAYGCVEVDFEPDLARANALKIGG